MIGYLLLALSLTGSLLLLWAETLASVDQVVRPIAHAPGVTLLKPLHGGEPQLMANLSSFLVQDYAGAVQIVFGVQRHDDPAIAVIEALRTAHPDQDIEIVVDERVHGANAKVSNLINLQRRARHDVIVISDSDIVVDPAYLSRLVATLAEPGVGAVSCLYRGRADAGIWSDLLAMGIDLHFLPATLIGLGTGLATPCMGSTIAMRAETLAAIGGFAAVADVLADDYAIGERVRAIGLRTEVLRTLVRHACCETSLAALLRHELRWNATIVGIDPGGFAGSIVLHPFPIALLAAALLGVTHWTGAALILAFGARAAMQWRLGGRALWRAALIPVRDLLSFGLFLATFLVRSVDWRGNILTIKRGRIVAAPETMS